VVQQETDHFHLKVLDLVVVFAHRNTHSPNCGHFCMPLQ
jgi:hypothetical protein